MKTKLENMGKTKLLCFHAKDEYFLKNNFHLFYFYYIQINQGTEKLVDFFQFFNVLKSPNVLFCFSQSIQKDFSRIRLTKIR